MEKLLYTGKAKQMWQTDDPEVLRVVLYGPSNCAEREKEGALCWKG